MGFQEDRLSQHGFLVGSIGGLGLTGLIGGSGFIHLVIIAKVDEDVSEHPPRLRHYESAVGSRFKIQGSRCRVQDLGFKV